MKARLFTWLFMPVILILAGSEKSFASEIEMLKAQLSQLRMEQAASQKAYQEQIEKVERQIFEVQGPVPTWIENSSQASKGFIDFNLYYDTENFSVLTVNAGADLPNDFSYFSLTNFSSDFGDSDYTDLNELYSEQNLTWSPAETDPIAWNIQWNIRSGENNDRFRLAPQWLVHKTPFLDKFFKAINATYKINFHLVQWDDETHGDYVWQMEHVYFMNVLPHLFDGKLYLSGFADHTFGGPGNPALVTEHQIGYRMIDNWFAVAEYRRNEYRKGNEDSLGLGIEYKVIFS